MKITEWVERPNPFGLVRIEGIVDKTIKDDDLDLEQQVSLRASKKLMEEILVFVGATAKFLVRYNMKSMDVNEIMQNAISILAKAFNHPSLAYHNANEVIQGIFAETDLTARLKKIHVALIDVRQRITVLIDLDSKAEAAQEEERKKRGRPKDERCNT